MGALLCVALNASAQDELEVLPVQGNVYMIAGSGGNTTVQIGPEAVVVVDTKTTAATERLLQAIKKLSSKPIRHVIVTSADPDHTGGNERVSGAGTYVRLLDTFDPRGSNTKASIIAHVNVLQTMSGPSGKESPTPAGAWPSDTYFTSEWALFVNNEAIQLLHVPAAHTDGDTMVFFRRSDVIATGDIYTPTGYPQFDPKRGGINGILDGSEPDSGDHDPRREPGGRHGGGSGSRPAQRRDRRCQLSRYGHDHSRPDRGFDRSRQDAGTGPGRTPHARLRRELHRSRVVRPPEQFVAAVYRDLKGAK